MKPLPYALVLCLAFASTASADSLEDRVTRLEREVELLKQAIADRAEKPAQHSAPPSTKGDPSADTVKVSIANKHYQPLDIENHILQQGLFWDTTVTLAANAKPVRAIKGQLIFMDLFDEVKMRIGWTINHPLKPGETFTEEGVGFEYNQFRDAHQWMRATEIKDMKVRFEVESIIPAE